MRKNITTKEMCEALGIERNMLTVYMDMAIPYNWEFKKSYKNVNRYGIYTFDENDYNLFYCIRELRKENIPYREIKKAIYRTTKEKGFDNMSLQHLYNFFSKGAEGNEDKGRKVNNIATTEIEPSLDLINIDVMEGEFLVSSREVARNFEKRNSEVNRAIEDLLKQTSVQNCTHLFISSEYKDKYNRRQNEYLLTRDGFSLLVMGFTGEKALDWKLKYIEAFNKMESKLKETNISRESYMIEDPVERAKAWIKEQKEKEELRLTTAKQQQIIGELKPKSDYTDRILQSNDLVTITQIAKDYGMSGQEMNNLLHDLKVQYKASGQWLLYRDHQDRGYTHSQTVEYIKHNGDIGTNMHTKWTQKGRLFLYDLLKQEEVLPLIEKNQQ